MLLEFVNRLVELAEKAKTTEITPIGFRTYTRNGEPETFPPPPRADIVFDAISLYDMLVKFADDCVIYCHTGGDYFHAIGVLDSTERADTIRLSSAVTPAYAALETIENGLPVRDLAEMLRTTLYDACPADVTHAVSRIDWTAKDAQHADAATMGRIVSKTVASSSESGDLPEMVTLTLPVFDIPDIVVDTPVRCAIVPNHDARTIAIISIDGRETIKEQAAQELCRRLADRFKDADTNTTTVYGRPVEKMFQAGSPAQ